MKHCMNQLCRQKVPDSYKYCSFSCKLSHASHISTHNTQLLKPRKCGCLSTDYVECSALKMRIEIEFVQSEERCHCLCHEEQD